jgi:hypothetical protein
MTLPVSDAPGMTVARPAPVAERDAASDEAALYGLARSIPMTSAARW